jgi:hypothetical protein
MSDTDTRYELPATGSTLLGYVVRRMHKTQLLMPVPGLISQNKTSDALAKVAMYAVASSTSYGRAYYQPRFDAVGDEVSEADPQTGALVKAKLNADSPTYLISYSAAMPNGDLFSGREEIRGTTLGLRGVGMPAPSWFYFKSGGYSAELTGILTSELVFSIIGRTRIRAHGFLIFNDSERNTGKVTVDRNNRIKLEVNKRHVHDINLVDTARLKTDG